MTVATAQKQDKFKIHLIPGGRLWDSKLLGVKDCERSSVRRRNSAVAMQRLQRLLFNTTDSRRNSVAVVDAEAAFEACSYFTNHGDSGK